MKAFSTIEVAKQVGVSLQTLERWIGNGEIPAPKTVCVGRTVVLEWTVRDVERVLTFKLQSYRKARTHKSGLGKSFDALTAEVKSFSNPRVEFLCRSIWPGEALSKRTERGHPLERTMVWDNTQSKRGRVVTCSNCSWWTPVHGEHSQWIGQEFKFHTCIDYPPLKFAGKDLEMTG